MAAPRIACRESVYDFGALEASRSVEHAFAIVNEGDAALEFGKVRACCGATASIAALSLPPGSSTACTVAFSLAGRRGPQNKSFYVASNDPKEPYLQLSLVGKVVQPMDIQPSTVDFGVLEVGAATNARVVIAPQPGLAMAVTNVTTPPGVSATFAPGSNGQWLADVRVASLPPGLTRGTVTFLTDQKDYPRINVGVMASVLPDIVVVPKEIVVTVAEGKPEPVSRHVALRSRKGRAFDILRVEAPEAGIRASHERLPSGGHRISLNDILPFDDLGGKELVIHTDHPREPTVAVPFVVAGRGAKPEAKGKTTE